MNDSISSLSTDFTFTLPSIKYALINHLKAMVILHSFAVWPCQYRFQIGNFMFLFKKGFLPDAFTSHIHRYNTRHCNSSYLFRCRTNIRQFAAISFFSSTSRMRTAISPLVYISVFGDKCFLTEANFCQLQPGKLPGLSRNGPLVFAFEVRLVYMHFLIRTSFTLLRV